MTAHNEEHHALKRRVAELERERAFANDKIVMLEAERDEVTKRWLHYNKQADRWSLRYKRIEGLLRGTEESLKTTRDHLDKTRLELKNLNARSCETCGRPCDTYDESDYQGDEPFYCARWRAKSTK